MSNYQEFFLVTINFILMSRLWDTTRRKFENATNKIDRRKFDLYWHLVSYLIQAEITVYAFYKCGLPLSFAFRFLPVFLASGWILLDFIWNITNNKNLMYQGDGTGSGIEEVMTKIAKLFRLKRYEFTIISKATFLIISIGWLIIYKFIF